jgi:hypothetical protein
MSLHNIEELVLGGPELRKDAALGEQGECRVRLFVELLPCKLEEDEEDREVEEGEKSSETMSLSTKRI